MKNDYKTIKPMKGIPDQLRKLRRQFLRYQQAEMYTAFLTRSCWSLPAMPGQSTASTARYLSTGRFLMPIWNASMNLQEKLPWRRSRTNERQRMDVL